MQHPASEFRYLQARPVTRRRVQGRPVFRTSGDCPGPSGIARNPLPEPGQRGMDAGRADVTRLLRAATSGERRDLDALMNAIYADLRRLALSHMRSERDDHTLQATALVHEAYLKLLDQRTTDWKDRAHFFAVGSQIIRRILVDHARERGAIKRGGDRGRMPIEEAVDAVAASGIDLGALDEALTELAAIDARQARIVELKFFGGLTIPEIAGVLSMGARSVDREWRAARAWLYCRLAGDDPGSPDG